MRFENLQGNNFQKGLEFSEILSQCEIWHVCMPSFKNIGHLVTENFPIYGRGGHHGHVTPDHLYKILFPLPTEASGSGELIKSWISFYNALSFQIKSNAEASNKISITFTILLPSFRNIKKTTTNKYYK